MMKKFYTLTVVLLCTLVFSPLVKGQDTWQQIESSEGVVISYRIESCHEQTFLSLQIKNTNEQPVSLEYEALTLYPNGETLPFTPTHHLFVNGSQTINTNCAELHPELYISLPKELSTLDQVSLNLKIFK